MRLFADGILVADINQLYDAGIQTVNDTNQQVHRPIEEGDKMINEAVRVEVSGQTKVIAVACTGELVSSILYAVSLKFVALWSYDII